MRKLSLVFVAIAAVIAAAVVAAPIAAGFVATIAATTAIPALAAGKSSPSALNGVYRIKWTEQELVAGGTMSAASPARTQKTLCVSSKPGCYSTIQAAVDAAHDGDTIRIDKGTFAGGVTINVSVNIVGAGASKTTIRGGGPVLTIGTIEGTNGNLTDSITGVTITGGLNNSHPDEGVSFGGGVWIAQSTNQTTGATVSISDSVITGNTVAPKTPIPPGDFCGPLPCGFGDGGGIDNAGTLTLTNTRMTNNQAGGNGTPASGLFDGGIANRSIATLTMRHCIVTGNRAIAGPPNGRQASTGGIGDDGMMTISDSVVSGNSAVLTGTSQMDEGASAGGISISGRGSAAISKTIISSNRVTASSSLGDEGTFAGGLLVEGSLTLDKSSVDHNQVSTAASGSAFSDAGGLEVDGTATISNSVILGNSVTATAGSGQAFAQGGGLANVGQTTLRKTLVAGNRVTANGTSGVAQGGGIWNSVFNDGDPQPMLILVESVVTANTVNANGGITPQGGGLFTTAPVTLTITVIAANKPDQCFGC